MDFSPIALCTLFIIIYQCLQAFCQPFLGARRDLARSTKDLEFIYPDFKVYKHTKLVNVNFAVIRNTQPNKFYVKFALKGKDFTLKLRRNRRLLNKGFNLENFGESITPTAFSKKHCHYIGRVLEDRHSKAAISACHGLKGFLEVNNEVYFIEPVKTTRFSFPHVVYKSREHFNVTHGTSTQEEVGYTCHTEPGDKEPVFETPGKKYKASTQDTNLPAVLSRRRKRGNQVDMLAADVHVFVVVDKDMVAFHGNDSLEEYILTMMNMVADLYKDRSLGALVNIIVSKILILHEDQEDLTISHHGDKTLRSFCEWQYSRVWYSGIGNQKILKYDAAVLITRKDVCVNRNSPCGTIGMAYIGGLCKAKRKCSVIEDIGLSTAFTIAHELGHSFGMTHDGEDNSCSMNSDGVPHMMSSRWPDENQVGALKWSSCSREVLVDFLSSYRSICLRPQPNSYRKWKQLDDNFMPGTIYDADQQCRQQYGSLAKHCKFFKTTGRPTDMCKQLWCQLEGEEECISKLDPVAKGTTCAPGKWCMYGNCINNNTIPDKVDGGWSEWTNWTECTRKCGIGVSVMSRRCNNPPPINGGRYCEGIGKQYRTCNVEPCPPDQRDPREEQCKQFNNSTFSWVPVNSNRNPCALYCRPDQDVVHLSVQFAPKVVDGTPCRRGSKDICIDGKCQRLGCDLQLNSKLERDVCGICGGNGTTCNVVEGEFTQPSGEGYVTAAVIPKGAQNVVVKEEKPCASFLALKSGVGTYHINGNWKIELPGEFNVNGTIIYYQREGTQEMFYTEGPTKAPLHIMVLFQDFNLGVKYRYTVPLKNETEKTTSVVAKNGEVSFGWMQGPWGRCSVVCGGGIMKRKKSHCIRMAGSNVSVVEDKFCSGAKKPKSEERTCNEQKCVLTWAVSSWTPCSRTCGIGRQKRDTRCVGQKKNGEWEIRRGRECPKDKPITVRSCVDRACYLSWQIGQWSRCRASCGRRGVMYRNVGCPIKNACSVSNKPSIMQVCVSPNCRYHWIASDWSSCSVTCGKGLQARKVVCVEEFSGKIKQGYCLQGNKPKSSRRCEMPSCTLFTPIPPPSTTRPVTNSTTPLSTTVSTLATTGAIGEHVSGFSSKDEPKKVKKKPNKKGDDCKKDIFVAWACKILADEYFCSNPKSRNRCCATCKRKKLGVGS